MSTIVFASEGPSQFSQMAAQLVIANRLRNQGHKVLFACTDIESVHSILARHHHGFVPAPRSLPSESRNRRPQDYVQALLRLGFGDPQTLAAYVNAWRNLFRTARAEVLVADHAPIALLAAAAPLVPRVVLGNPFTIPGLDNPAQDIQHRLPDEALILDCANKALAERNCSPLRKISDLFAGAPRLVTTFPELDVARDSASIRVGPMTDQVESQTAEWVASQNRPRILAQLRGDTPGLQMLLQHLRAVNGDVICCILGGESAAFRNLRGIRVIAEPVTPGLLRDASAFVANGQTESVALAAKAGIPQVHVVFDAVGKMNAQLAAARGVAIPVVTKNARASFGESIRKAILDKRYRAAASQLAAKCINYDADEMIIRAAAIIINEIR